MAFFVFLIFNFKNNICTPCVITNYLTKIPSMQIKLKYILLPKTAAICKHIRAYFIFLFFLFGNLSFAQENTITVGLQFKPIIPIKFFFKEGADISSSAYNFQVEQQFGTSWGMVIRKGFSKRFSLETGISYINRSYSINIIDSSIQKVNDRFHLIAYEIPINGLIYIRLSDKIYMNAALGISLDIFPSDIYTENDDYKHYSLRKSWLLPGVSANLGYEYRTPKSGFFYLGASYHRPFYDMYNSVIEYDKLSLPAETIHTTLAGNYLTIDFRYFFHADPLKKKVKKDKNSDVKKQQTK